jgi:hypothetical protein
MREGVFGRRGSGRWQQHRGRKVEVGGSVASYNEVRRCCKRRKGSGSGRGLGMKTHAGQQG